MALLLCEQRAYGRITFHALCLFLKWIKLFFFLSSEDANILNVVQNIKTFAPLCGSEQMWALKKFGQFGPPLLQSLFKCILTSNAYQQICVQARLHLLIYCTGKIQNISFLGQNLMWQLELLSLEAVHFLLYSKKSKK